MSTSDHIQSECQSAPFARQRVKKILRGHQREETGGFIALFSWRESAAFEAGREYAGVSR